MTHEPKCASIHPLKYIDEKYAKLSEILFSILKGPTNQGRIIPDNKTHNTIQFYKFSGIFMCYKCCINYMEGQSIEPEENPGFLDITTCKELHLKKSWNN